MSKLQTLAGYLAEHEFLREAADFHSKLTEDLSDVKPLDLPPLEEVLKLVRAEKIPLLQQEKFQAQVLDATERFLPRVLSKSLLRQENLSVKKSMRSQSLTRR